MAALRPEAGRRPAGCDLLLGRDEHDRESRDRAPRRSGLHGEEVQASGPASRAAASGGPTTRPRKTRTGSRSSPEDLDQNSVGTLTLDPSDKKHDTLYLGTGEANRCSSGCEAGVGIYKSTDGGNHWTKLADTCVSNPTYPCATPGGDAFLGRGINSIVIDPTELEPHPGRIRARPFAALSHVIGAGGETQRFEPGANEPGVYESTRRRLDVHRGLERRQALRRHLVRHHGRRPRPARRGRRLRGRLRRRRVAARRRRGVDCLPAGVQAAVQPGRQPERGIDRRCSR